MPLVGTHYAKYLDKYNGMVENGGYNRGVWIDIANRIAYPGAPYCASGQSLAIAEYNLAQTDANLKISLAVRSARARDFILPTSLDARLVYYNKQPLPPAALSIYTRTGGGHIAYKYGNRQFHFNSSPGRGSQWNGTWSGWKQEDVKSLCSPLRAFRITHFTKLT